MGNFFFQRLNLFLPPCYTIYLSFQTAPRHHIPLFPRVITVYRHTPNNASLKRNQNGDEHYQQHWSLQPRTDHTTTSTSTNSPSGRDGEPTADFVADKTKLSAVVLQSIPNNKKKSKFDLSCLPLYPHSCSFGVYLERF